MIKTTSKTNAELMQRRNRAVPRGPFHVAPVFAAKAEGAILTDVEGNTYIDFCGGIGVQNVGHNHPRVVAAVKQQVEAFLHTCFHVAPYESYVALAERLNRAVPIDGPCKTALFNSGAEAVENAVKIARAASGRPAVVAFERGFHGRTLMTMTLTGKCRPYTAGFGPYAPEVYRLPVDPFFAADEAPDEEVEAACRAALDHLSHYHIEPEAIACVIVEPVLGEGGFMPIHRTGARVLGAWTRENGVLLVADEVQTGFARCGALFASERRALEPDLITMAKSLAGGTVLSAVTGRADIVDAPGVGGIGGTYGGNPLSVAAALAVLDIIEEEDLCERAEAIGQEVMRRFRELMDEHPIISDARGLGAMCALELTDPATSAPCPEKVAEVCREALKRGLLVMSASGNVIRTLMPLTISDDDLEKGLDILSASIAAVQPA
jgi:4-aminobutyrate aminotransferase / (S)-3-amino-2-methylpropionate transaminase / 5-aminovalerate transaminase